MRWGVGFGKHIKVWVNLSVFSFLSFFLVSFFSLHCLLVYIQLYPSKLLLSPTMTTPNGAAEPSAVTRQRVPSYLLTGPPSPISISPPASPSVPEFNRRHSSGTQYSYRPCPICEEKLLVRIDGSLVHKWINSHFSSRHHEWLHTVVNLHEI